MSGRCDIGRLQHLGLALLVAVAAASVLRIHLWPRQLHPSLPPAVQLPGTPLPSLLGRFGSMRATSATRRWRLSSGWELRLTTLMGFAVQGFQVAEFTRPLPALDLRQRRLRQRATGEVGLGLIGPQPAAQTCLLQKGHALTATALAPLLRPRPRDLRASVLRLLGWRPHQPDRCLLVTLLLPPRDGRMNPEREQQLMAHLDLILPGLSSPDSIPLAPVSSTLSEAPGWAPP